jgi:spermidine/putrescine transport system ATP-binding protein
LRQAPGRLSFRAMGSREAAGAIVIDQVTKRFGEFTAVDDVSFTIRDGEFFTMLGPSGCGKTTTLRMIAGFEEPTAGRILLRDQDVTFVPPAKRNVNMVFQAYALFPHMSVWDNIAFGLKIKKVAKGEVAQRVEEAIQTVRLAGFEKRRPGQLSGGQQQRVALARALVNRPAALLLDEPLGALDLKLRKELQLELKHLQLQTQTTFVYVTHDQEEALTMSDRIAVMNDGVVEQIATPRELYEHPATSFVAGFIGVSNLISMRCDRVEGATAVMDLGEGERIVAPAQIGRRAFEITIRPEKIKLDAPESNGDASRVSGRVIDVVYLGSTTQVMVELRTGEQLTVHQLNDEVRASPSVGDAVVLQWAGQHSYVVGNGGGAPDDVAPEDGGEDAAEREGA